MPAGTAKAKPRSPPNKNFNSLVILSGRALHSVASVMKNAKPCVINSNAVTISPEIIFKKPGCAWSDNKWCDQTVHDTINSTNKAPLAIFCM